MKNHKHNQWIIGAVAVSHIWLVSAGYAAESDHDHDHDHRMELREGHVDLLVLFEEEEGLHLALAAGEHDHHHEDDHDENHDPRDDHDHHDDPDPGDEHDPGDDHDHEHIELADAVIVVGPAALAAVPAGAAFGFLGAAGDHVFVLPQAEAEHLPFLGLNTEELDAELFEGEVTLALAGVEGPGAFFLYQNDAFGQPDLLLDGRAGAGGSMRLPVGIHAHANWAFTWPGDYVLTFTLTATRQGGGVLEITGPENGWFRGLGGILLHAGSGSWAWSEETGWLLPAGVHDGGNAYNRGPTGDWILADPAHAPWYWNFNASRWERWDD
jgi:surface-anchored protein